MKNCKYTLRHHLDTLIRFEKDLWNYSSIGYDKKILMSGSLIKRINNIKGYLSIPLDKIEKKSINTLFKEGIKQVK